MTPRRIAPRVAAPAILVAALACFALSWITVTTDERTSHATGLALVSGHVSYSGRYLHDAWRGEVEAVMHDAHVWTPLAFAALLVALALVVLPWRWAWWSALVAAGLAVIFLVLWLQATSQVYQPPYVERHVGFWLALALTPLVAVPIVVRLMEPTIPDALRRPPEWLGRSEHRPS